MTTMVLIPKSEHYYRGIGLVEVIWKFCVLIVNNIIRNSVTLHDTLHRFRQGRGVETATLEAKMAQKLAGIFHEPLFQVFIYVRKSYDSLDRGRFMDILRGYVLYINLHRLIQRYWD